MLLLHEAPEQDSLETLYWYAAYCYGTPILDALLGCCSEIERVFPDTLVWAPLMRLADLERTVFLLGRYFFVGSSQNPEAFIQEMAPLLKRAPLYILGLRRGEGESFGTCVISAQEMLAVAESCTALLRAEKSRFDFSEGDLLRIREGPLAGFVGRCVRASGEYVYLELPLFKERLGEARVPKFGCEKVGEDGEL